jgi:hypothetical protein
MSAAPSSIDPLVADLDKALEELMAPFFHDRSLWGRGVPGRWTAGQHVEHVAISMEVFRAALERALEEQRAGKLGPPPRRGLLPRLLLGLVFRTGRFPRGARTPARFEAGAAPDQAAVFHRLAEEARALHAIGAGLEPAAREALWIANPFRPSWHYTFPETLRVHAIHARHHHAIVLEIAVSAAKPA